MEPARVCATERRSTQLAIASAWNGNTLQAKAKDRGQQVCHAAKGRPAAIRSRQLKYANTTFICDSVDSYH